MKKNNIIEHFRKHWLTYLLIIAVGILLYMLLSGNKPVESHRTEAELLKKENTALQIKLAEADRKDIIDRNVIVSQDSTIRTVRTVITVTTKELDKTKAIANRLSREVRELQPEDTSLYAHKVDSLAQQTEDLTVLVHDYEGTVDSLSSLYDQQKITYEKMLDDKVKINQLLRDSYDKVSGAYDGLYTDYGKLSKQVKREKLKTKIAGIIGLAAIGFLIAK